MSKEERYTYHCDQYDYVEIIYDNEECEEIDSMKMAEKRLNRQQDKISDLEAKLAEKEDRINWLVEAEFNRKWAKKYVEMRRKEDPMLCLPDSDEVYEKYFELKQQLATQENTITNLVEDNRASQEWYKKQLAEKDKEIMEFASKVDLLESEKENLFRTLEEANEEHQDKISFALEQLEKAKELMFSIWQKSCGEELLISGIETIDNQIKQLKEQQK